VTSTAVNVVSLDVQCLNLSIHSRKRVQFVKFASPLVYTDPRLTATQQERRFCVATPQRNCIGIRSECDNWEVRSQLTSPIAQDLLETGASGLNPPVLVILNWKQSFSTVTIQSTHLNCQSTDFKLATEESALGSQRAKIFQQSITLSLLAGLSESIRLHLLGNSRTARMRERPAQCAVLL